MLWFFIIIYPSFSSSYYFFSQWCVPSITLYTWCTDSGTPRSQLGDFSTGHVGGPFPGLDICLKDVPEMGYLHTDSWHGKTPIYGWVFFSFLAVVQRYWWALNPSPNNLLSVMNDDVKSYAWRALEEGKVEGYLVQDVERSWSVVQEYFEPTIIIRKKQRRLWDQMDGSTVGILVGLLLIKRNATTTTL